MATKEEILESISNMSVMDLVDLISDIEEKFGVTAAAVAAAPAAAAGAAADGGEEAAEEKSAYDVVLTASVLSCFFTGNLIKIFKGVVPPRSSSIFFIPL